MSKKNVNMTVGWGRGQDHHRYREEPLVRGLQPAPLPQVRETEGKQSWVDIMDQEIPEAFRLPVALDLVANTGLREQDTQRASSPKGQLPTRASEPRDGKAQRANSPSGLKAEANMPCQDIREMDKKAAVIRLDPQTTFVVLKEPYQNWRRVAISMVKRLTPVRNPETGRINTGYIAQIVTEKDDKESYIVTVRYDINQNPGAKLTSWVAVMESLLRNMDVDLTRDKRTGAPVPFASQREKARCGIKLRVALKTVGDAAGI